MDILREILAAREQGGLPISIGTSLAVEAVSGLLPDTVPDPQNPIPVLAYKEFWINLRTIYRNLVGTLDSTDRAKMQAEPLQEALQAELTVIESAVTKASEGRCRVVYYICSYKTLKGKFPNALLKDDRTELQKANRLIEYQTLKPYLEGQSHHDVRVFDCELKPTSVDALILTNYPTDLLADYSFSKLVLVESHTGTIKTRLQWNTKLTGGKDLLRIPFCKFSLQLFGDGSTLFNGFPIKLRQEVLRVATDHQWSALTTNEKIRAGINSIYDPRVKTVLLGLL